MKQSASAGALPSAARRAFDKAAKLDWKPGVPLPELLDRVNRVALVFAGGGEGGAGRVKKTFTERSFRHYQTLGCIDAPEKDGRRTSYGLRHFLQALLVRKLLWDRVPAERIGAIMSGRGSEELERMLLGGVEIVARVGGTGGPPEDVAVREEEWKRLDIAPGVELHLRDGVPRGSPRWRKMVIERLEAALRRARG